MYIFKSMTELQYEAGIVLPVTKSRQMQEIPHGNRMEQNIFASKNNEFGKVMSNMFSFLLLTTFSLPCLLYGKDSFKMLNVSDLKAYLVTCPDRRENSSIF